MGTSLIFLLAALLLPTAADGQPTTQNSQRPAKIEWLTNRGELAAALLKDGKADVEFKAGADLEKVVVWITPSLEGILTAEPAAFDKIIKDQVYKIQLKLKEELERTAGGTLHLRDGQTESATRTYASPFPINVKVKGKKEKDKEKDDDEEDEDEVVPIAVVSSANYGAGPVGPGQVVSVFGSGLGPKEGAGLSLNKHGRVSDYVGDTQVLFDGVAAPILFVNARQLNAVVPLRLGPQSEVEMIIAYKGKVSKSVLLPVQAAAPALFSVDGSGEGQGAILNENTSANSASNPARRGSVVVLYGTGFGRWKETVVDGEIIGDKPPTPELPVEVKVGGLNARVVFVGGAPGLVNGIVQLNIELPAGASSGRSVPIVVSVGGKPSKEVTVAVQ